MTSTELDIDSILSSENLTRENILELKEDVFTTKEQYEKFEKKVKKLKSSCNQSEETSELKDQLLVLGICYWILGDIEDAITALNEMKTRKIASYFLGKCHMESGDYEKAIECFERSKHSDAEEYDIQMDVAETKRMAGDLQDALKLIKKLSKTHDNEARLHCQWAHCLDDLYEYDEALTHYNKALEINPNHVNSLFRLAYNYDLDGEDEKAVEYYEKCIEQVPLYANAVMNLGILYEDEARYEKAVSCFELVLQAYPDHEKANFFLKNAKESLTMYYDEGKEKTRDITSETLNIPISDFELSVRSKNCLDRMNIKTLADLTRVSEADLLSYKNFGETSLNEIKQILNQKTLYLGQKLEGKKLTEKLVDVDAFENKDDLEKPISELAVSTRCENVLAKMEINTIGDLVSKTETDLFEYKGFKQIHYKEIKKQLEGLGFHITEGNNNQETS